VLREIRKHFVMFKIDRAVKRHLRKKGETVFMRNENIIKRGLSFVAMTTIDATMG
jgi:hypothetical protein